MAIATIAFAGCEKGKDYADNGKIANTHWDAVDASPYNSISIHFDFGNGRDRAYWETYDNDGNNGKVDYKIGWLKFRYEEPNITMWYDDGSGVFGSGYIDGDTMYLTEGIHDGEYKKH